MKTALITLGRLPKALDIAAALHGAGWRVVIAEPSPWHLCRVSRHVAKTIAITAPNVDRTKYLNELLQVIEDESVSLVVPVSEEALHAVAVAERMPEGVTLFSEPLERLLEVHDKDRFVELAASFGLKVPKTALLGTPEAQRISEDMDYILKPVSTCSGQGLLFHKRNDALPDAKVLPASVVQEELTGRHRCSFSIAHQGRVIGTIVYEAAILSGTVAVAFRRLPEEQDILGWVDRFVEKTEWSGMIAFDFIDGEDGGPRAIECNPRATSGIHFIEPKSLASAIVEPATATGLEPRKEMVLKQFWPCLTEVQTAMIRRKDFGEKLKVLWSAREVNFSWRDPLPLVLMPFTSWSILWRSIKMGESFGEASTHDIAWFGEDHTGDDPEATETSKRLRFQT